MKKKVLSEKLKEEIRNLLIGKEEKKPELPLKTVVVHRNSLFQQLTTHSLSNCKTWLFYKASLINGDKELFFNNDSFIEYINSIFQDSQQAFVRRLCDKNPKCISFYKLFNLIQDDNYLKYVIYLNSPIIQKLICLCNNWTAHTNENVKNEERRSGYFTFYKIQYVMWHIFHKIQDEIFNDNMSTTRKFLHKPIMPCFFDELSNDELEKLNTAKDRIERLYSEDFINEESAIINLLIKINNDFADNILNTLNVIIQLMKKNGIEYNNLVKIVTYILEQEPKEVNNKDKELKMEFKYKTANKLIRQLKSWKILNDNCIDSFQEKSDILNEILNERIAIFEEFNIGMKEINKKLDDFLKI